jgi:hypothetical protein
MDLKPVSVKKEKEEVSTERGSHSICTGARCGWHSLPLLASSLLARTLRRPVGASEWPALQRPGAQTEKLAESRASGRSKNRGWKCP